MGEPLCLHHLKARSLQSDEWPSKLLKYRLEDCTFAKGLPY